ncbi:hypothetical protein TPA0910_82350 [Streptomyces hygroscopicus subsp. sporocinereus]|uniref:Uncharacterized protein n=1 Tax=Streptomyces hygroscopicus TaxID=1912 RepID=A0ABQ3UDY2_STRHY|nr:hypothetical protein TPA0910_82350 [Streptomyces hygroscopicus]
MCDAPGGAFARLEGMLMLRSWRTIRRQVRFEHASESHKIAPQWAQHLGIPAAVRRGPPACDAVPYARTAVGPAHSAEHVRVGAGIRAFMAEPVRRYAPSPADDRGELCEYVDASSGRGSRDRP